MFLRVICRAAALWDRGNGHAGFHAVSLPHLKCSRDIGGEKCFKKQKLWDLLFFVFCFVCFDWIGERKRRERRGRHTWTNIPGPSFHLTLKK
jgi:hypothetical protein